MYYRTQYVSPIGTLTLASDGTNLNGLWIEGQRYFGGTPPLPLAEEQALPVFDAAADWLERYFAGARPAPEELPLRPLGSAFRRTVWQLLCEIPSGTIVTYGALARRAAERLGREHVSAQAVGGAVGHNPISIIIPCHRVVGASGSLTGYAGGVQTKLWLLRHEGADTSALSVPARGTAI